MAQVGTGLTLCTRGNAELGPWMAHIEPANFIAHMKEEYPDCNPYDADKTGETPLMKAAFYGNFALVEYIVDKVLKRNIDKSYLNLGSADEKYTALDCAQMAIQCGISQQACESGLACTRLFLSAGADPNISLHPNLNALDWAEERKTAYYATELANLYIAYGAHGNKEGPFVQQLRKATVLKGTTVMI